jgi:hypothetical protein
MQEGEGHSSGATSLPRTWPCQSWPLEVWLHKTSKLALLSRAPSGTFLPLVLVSVVDPDSLNSDLDPAFQLNPDSDTGPDPGCWWKKMDKLLILKEHPSFRREPLALKKWNLLTFYFIFVGHFCPTGSGSGSGSGSTTRVLVFRFRIRILELK